MESSGAMSLLVAIKAVLSVPIAPIQGIISADDTFQYFQHEFYQSHMKDEVSTLKILIGFLQEKLEVAEQKIAIKTENSVLATPRKRRRSNLEEQVNTLQGKLYRMEFYLQEDKAHISKLKIYVRDLQLNK